MFDRIIAWSLRNRTIVVLLYVVLAGAAMVAASRMSLDVFPEFAPPQVQIQTEAPGYAASDVELLVTRPLEVALSGMEYVDQIRSESSIGLSRITIVFRPDTDVYRARLLSQERIQLARPRLPTDIEPPQLMPVTSAVSWLLKFALIDWSAEPDPLELRSLVDWEFRNRLLAQPGVASVEAVGGGEKQYQVMVDPLALNSLNIPFSRVVDAAAESNRIGAGAFVYPSREEEYFVRLNGRIRSLSDLEQSPIDLRAGSPILMGDVAEVRFGEAIKRGDGQVFGANAVIGTVSKQWGADTMETTRRVEETLASLGAALPADIQLISDVFRQASFIDTSIDNLRAALLHASLIVAAVLFLFLVRWRPTAISLIAIPVSLLMGVLVLWVFGIGINALTLGGLVFAVGEVVDDAIIDVENILRRLRERAEKGEDTSTFEIVYEGSREIRNSVVFATAIVVVAFMPIFFLTGIEGRIFVPLAVAYLAAVGSSLIVALTLIPVLCQTILARRASAHEVRTGSLTAALRRHYGRALGWSIDRPRLALAVGLVSSAAVLVLLFSLGRSFLPGFHEGNIVIATTMMPGASLEENLRLGREIEARIGEVPGVASIAQRAGRSRLDEDAQPVNFSEFDVTLSPGVDVTAALAGLREALADLPGVQVNVSQFITHRMQEVLSGVRAQVAVKLYGPELDVLQRQQAEILEAVRGIDGMTDLMAEPMIHAPGVDVRVDRAAAAAHGFTPGEIARQAGQAFNGVTVSRVLEADRAYDLVVRVADVGRTSIERLGAFPLQSTSGAVVPLREVADVIPVSEPYMINREAGARRAVVQWNVQGRDLDSVVREAQVRIADAVELAPGYTLEFGGDYVGQQRATRNLLLSGTAAVLLIFTLMLYAFRHLSLTLLVMSNLPFALLGGLLALMLFGETLNVPAIIGLIALFGVSTRNAILLVNRYAQLTAARPGFRPRSIALEGAGDRMLPILMTALTTMLAVLPFLIGDPAGKELERPLAIVLLGGMLSATALNLFVLPAGYTWLAARWPYVEPGARQREPELETVTG